MVTVQTLPNGVVHVGSEKWVFPSPILDEARFRVEMAGVSDDNA